MRALITGAGGFCGQRLISYLEEQGVEVHTLGCRDIKRHNHHYIDDVTCVTELTAALKPIKPDYVFHLAGVTKADDPTIFYRVNTQYAVGLLCALENTGSGNCPVLLAGTSAEYGMVSEKQLPIREDIPPNPYNHYGISKLAQTLVGLTASRNSRPIVVARPFNIIGPGMPKYLVVENFAVQIIEIIKKRKSPVIEVGNLESSRDFVDVDEVVRTYWQLIQTPSAYGEVVNICSGKGTTIGDILQKLITLSNVEIEVRADASRFKPIDVPVHFGSTEKLQRLVGYVPCTNLDATLKRILDELRNR